MVSKGEYIHKIFQLPMENLTAVTAAVCSAKVTKQNPDMVAHNLTLPSWPPVAIVVASGLKETVAMLLKWPCCLRT